MLGIDPGRYGALAWVTMGGHLIDILDMPAVEVRGKSRVSAQLVAEMMRERPADIVIIEGVGAMPKQGVASSFTFGYCAGLLEGVAAGLGRPVEIVPAATWKRLAKLSADKGAMRQAAIRLWPEAADRFRRVKDDGRAEAALMARWAGSRPGLS